MKYEIFETSSFIQNSPQALWTGESAAIDRVSVLPPRMNANDMAFAIKVQNKMFEYKTGGLIPYSPQVLLSSGCFSLIIASQRVPSLTRHWPSANVEVIVLK